MLYPLHLKQPERHVPYQNAIKTVKVTDFNLKPTLQTYANMDGETFNIVKETSKMGHHCKFRERE